MKKQCIGIIILLLCMPLSLYAQSTSSPEPSKKSPKLTLQEFQAFKNKQRLTEMELREALLKAEYEYDTSVYQHRRKVFDWQHTSSVITFWMVIFIVLAGLFFSGMQFYISLKREKERLKKPRETPENQESVTEFEASLKGIKVSSSVIGIIILVISLAFFYLYLVHVYPVNEVKRIEQVEQGVDKESPNDTDDVQKGNDN